MFLYLKHFKSSKVLIYPVMQLVMGLRMKNEGSINLLRLKKLERLDLGSNVFNRSIIQSLRFLKSLKTLSLFDNFLEGSFPAKELSVFEELEMLDLSDNQLNGSPTVQGREIEKIIF
ncbi:receptor-like protein 15 [Quercus suber]|uniref:Receptor-like protein 15 n=1 Tax=Quercus suber TaxID=58331 RepID=A0AAW0L5S2_QUESU